MKATKLTSLLVIALAFTLAGTGCQKRPSGVTPLNNRTTVVRPGEDLEPVPLSDGGLGSEEGIAMNPPGWMTDPSAHTEDAAALAANVVHFDYDSSVVKANEQGNVTAVASYLSNNPGTGLRIDGHCDERGTEGYNDALGERRASALRDSIISMGVEPNRIITQSFGERKPVAFGSDESAWAQNRRGEFIVLHPK